MSEHLRQFFNRSRQLIGAVFTRSSSARTSTHTEHGAKSYSTAYGEAPRRQDPSHMVTLLERINHRLDSIEQKIDQLLMPMDVIKH
jgi:hypothetical protein